MKESKIFNNYKKYIKIFFTLFISIMLLGTISLKAEAFAFYDSADNIFAIDLVLNERANVDGDAILLGETVNFAGHVSGNVIAGGNNVSILADEIRNAFVMAKENVTINADSRAIYVIGNNIKIITNTRSAYIIGKNVRISGSVDGDLTIIATKIEFANDLKVAGTLKVESPTEPVYPEGIENVTVTYKRIDENEKEESLTSKLFRLSRFLIFLAPTGLVTALIYIKLLGPFKRNGVKMLKKSPVKVFLCGIIMLIGMPAVSFIFMIALVGLPTALIMIMIYAICLLLAVPCMGVAIGEILFPDQSEYISGLIGTLINSLLVAIPYFGVIVYLISLLYTYGMLCILMVDLAKKETSTERRQRRLSKGKGLINKIKNKGKNKKEDESKNESKNESKK